MVKAGTKLALMMPWTWRHSLRLAKCARLVRHGRRSVSLSSRSTPKREESREESGAALREDPGRDAT